MDEIDNIAKTTGRATYRISPTKVSPDMEQLYFGKYEDISDLISYEENKYLPQIDINIELNGDDEQCDVLLDSKEGFKVITPLTYKIKDTRICSSDGNSCFISIEDAKRFIISNYKLFEPYKHIAAHKMYHPDLSQEERFLNFSNS